MPKRERKKKDGERKDKKNQRMRAAVESRKRRAGSLRPSTDQADVQRFKPGSPSDDTWQRTQSGEPPGRQTATTRPRAR